MAPGKQLHSQAPLPQPLIDRILKEAGPSLVLVGGQALAWWMSRYDIALPDRFETVSSDIDFLARSAGDVREVERMARVIQGYSILPSKRALTSLVGQAVRYVSEDEYFNIGIIHRVLGSHEGMRRRVVRATMDEVVFNVLHPIDVLGSRLVNLHLLPDKQNDAGDMQMRAGIEVGAAYLREVAASGERREILNIIEIYADMALSDAGRKVAARRGLHVADAIPPDALPDDDQFLSKRLPQLLTLMSDAARQAHEASEAPVSVRSGVPGLEPHPKG